MIERQKLQEKAERYERHSEKVAMNWVFPIYMRFLRKQMKKAVKRNRSWAYLFAFDSKLRKRLLWHYNNTHAIGTATIAIAQKMDTLGYDIYFDSTELSLRVSWSEPQ